MSISSIITGGFGAPGSASLVITDGYSAGAAPPPVVQTVTPGVVAKPKRRRGAKTSVPVPTTAPVAPQPVKVQDDPYDWSEVTRRVQASLERDRKARARRNTQRLLLLMAA